MSDLGFYALRLALLIAGVGVAAGIVAGLGGRAAWAVVARRAVWAVFALVAFAMASLFHALVTFDFRLQYVADHIARSMALPYRFAALWGGQSGSLLLWLFLLTVFASVAALVHRRSHPRLMPWVYAVLLANASFFLVLLNFVTNPFTKLPPSQVLSDGAGLNPLLQHPLMTIHPLMLYTGFTGFSVPFAFAFAALVTGELGTVWLRSTRRWTLVPWAILSVGILLGGRWAYEVLGWGGYWAWDPVENASIMPWLAGTAYLHSVMIQEKRDMLKVWNLVLVGLTYSLCLFATFLTRSGVVASVHSFTESGWFGFIFLGYVGVVAGLYFSVLYWRRNRLHSTSHIESLVSREASFVVNNWLFMGILAIVIWGTLLPVISQAVAGVKYAFLPRFFDILVGPLAVAVLFLTGVGPLVAWRRASLTSLRRQFQVPLAAWGVAVVVLLAAFRGHIPIYPLLIWSLAVFVAATIAQEYVRAVRVRMRKGGELPFAALATLLRKNQRRYGGYIVHLGIVFVLIGVAGAAFNQEKLETLKPGEKAHIAQYTLEYLTAKPLPSRHYGGAVARLALYEGKQPLAVMAPERRIYWAEEQPASIPSIYSTLREDLYVTLTAIEPDGSATLKIHCNPLVNWLWIGGFTFVLGAIVLLWPHPDGRPGRGSA